MDQPGWDSVTLFLVVVMPILTIHLLFRYYWSYLKHKVSCWYYCTADGPMWKAFRVLVNRTLHGCDRREHGFTINRYTADRKIRSDDAYSPNNEPNKRPDRAATVYRQRCT